jgi:hypothetical protein
MTCVSSNFFEKVLKLNLEKCYVKYDLRGIIQIFGLNMFRGPARMKGLLKPDVARGPDVAHA